jgi:HlyD family secretion protein
MKIKRKRLIILIIGIVVLLLLIILLTGNRKKQEYTFSTAKVQIGSVSTVITATGTIEAIKTVEVGTQVSGEIRKIYVDYNSQVKAGQLLAELDRKPLVTALTIAEASLDDAKAEMTYQSANYNRIKALYEKKLVAEADYDLALYNFEKAKTTLKTAQLNYDRASINLGYAYIYSPIDGVVLNRAVDEGQTVAASFNTPTLFTIANDLTRMQVEASIDEADIGQIRNNQRVDFTVDAYPDEKFAGIITQIRLEPVIVSNVVTYTVIVEAPNPEKKLMPGMTASINVYVEEADSVLTIPSRALRFKPDEKMLAAYIKKLPTRKDIQDFPGKNEIQNRENTIPYSEINNVETRGEMSKVWRKDGNAIYPVRIQTGIDNDVDVQVISGLKEGDEIVVSMNTGYSATNTGNQETPSSPFMPRPPSRRGSRR